MHPNSTAILLLALTVAVLLAFAVAALAFALARWDGATVPSALSRSGIAFATALTLCLAVLAAVSR